LKKLAKKKGLSGYSKSKKDDLIKMLRKKQSMKAPKIDKNTNSGDENTNSSDDKNGKGWRTPKISDVHKVWNRTSSRKKHKLFTSNPDEWEKYHYLHDEMEESFPTKEIPRNIITRYMQKIKTASTKKVLDLGCGRKHISDTFIGDDRYDFTNYDLVNGNDDIVECDISDLPNDDNTVDVCIMSLCMLGKNCHDYITEAHRVLETNGILYISEPAKRWSSETIGDKLEKLLSDSGFRILKSKKDKFVVYVCMKK